MFLDNSLMIADALAHDGTPTVIDLGAPVTGDYGVGPGEPVRLMISGSSDLAGCTGFVMTDGATVAAADPLETRTVDLVGKVREIILPTSVGRYLKIDLQGTTSAGTWTCGVVVEGVQTNR